MLANISGKSSSVKLFKTKFQIICLLKALSFESGWYESRRSTIQKEYRGSGEEELIKDAGFDKVEFDAFNVPVPGDENREGLSWYARNLAASMSPTLHIAGIATKRQKSLPNDELL